MTKIKLDEKTKSCLIWKDSEKEFKIKSMELRVHSTLDGVFVSEWTLVGIGKYRRRRTEVVLATVCADKKKT